MIEIRSPKFKMNIEANYADLNGLVKTNISHVICATCDLILIIIYTNYARNMV